MQALDAPAAPPRTYADWSCWLAAFAKANCDGELLRLAGESRTEWTAAVAQMFGARMHRAMTDRLDAVGRRLSGRLQGCASEAALTLALVQARQEFQALARFAELRVLPQALRDGLESLVRDHLDGTQKALEKAAVADRTGRFALVLRRSPVNQPPAVEAAPRPPARLDAAPPSGRRVMMDEDHGA